jgi:hypothetical protein
VNPRPPLVNLGELLVFAVDGLAYRVMQHYVIAGIGLLIALPEPLMHVGETPTRSGCPVPIDELDALLSQEGLVGRHPVVPPELHKVAMRCQALWPDSAFYADTITVGATARVLRVRNALGVRFAVLPNDL